MELKKQIKQLQDLQKDVLNNSLDFLTGEDKNIKKKMEERNNLCIKNNK